MRKLIVLPLFLVLVAIFYFGWNYASQPLCKKSCSSQIFVVNKGESLGSVAQRLEEEKLIRSSVFFQILATKEGITRKIQAGNFKLNPGMSALEIAKELIHGNLDIWVTLLEGWRREEIVAKLASLSLANFSYDRFLEETKNLEGQLFPDTYLLPKDADSKRIVQIIFKNFQKKAQEPSRETLIMASVVEREVRGKEDRQIVAGILLKRIAKGWPLQADATVQYAVGTSRCVLVPSPCQDWWPKDLTKEDIKIKSSYNTYLNRGLPPGPICNPGLGAIEAVLNPTQTDYWFYLSDLGGNIHYAKTQEEHAANIQKYLFK